jgi:HSP20 family protein
MANIAKHADQNRSQMRDFFNTDDFFSNNWLSRLENKFPAVNISDNEKEYEIELIAPGFKKEDLKVKVEDDVLTISAESKQEMSNGNKEYTRREYSYNAFTRSFHLPENIKDDNIKANYADGVLKLSLPKSQSQVRARKEIAIN